MRMLVVVIVVDLSLLERFGLIERGEKEVERCADRDLKYCGNFFIKNTHDTDN